MLVISNFDKIDSENKTYKSSIYTLPINGGTQVNHKKLLLIGMVGVQMARHWHVQNEMGILIFTQYPLMEEKKD
jgi:hypothetical protein